MVYTKDKREYDKAISLFEKMTKLRPDIMNAHYNIAYIYARQNKTKESIGWLKNAVKMGFKNWDLLKTGEGWESIRSSSYYKELIKAH